MKILNLLIKNAIKLWRKNGKSWDPVAKTFVEVMQAQCWENVKRYLEKAQQYKSRRLFFENITFVTMLNSWGFSFTCPNQSPLDYVHKNRAFQPCYQQWKGSQTGDDLIWKACWRIGAQVVTAPHGLGRRRREENGPQPKKIADLYGHDHKMGIVMSIKHIMLKDEDCHDVTYIRNPY